MPHTAKLPSALSVTQAATFANVHPETVRRWIRQKDLKAYKCGRLHRIFKHDLVDFITKGPEGPLGPGGTTGRGDRT